MIQRIQSIYLLIAAIATIILIFIPIGYITTDEYQYVFNSFVVKLNIPETSVYMSTVYIALLLGISAILSIVAIFMYKNRKNQTTIVYANMLIFLITVLVMTYLYPDVIFVRKGLMNPNDLFNFNYWILACMIPAALGLYLANRAIKKDEEKVKAADRLR
jgi:cytochrome bd-type quinol oxidase subunit 2